MIRKVVCNLAAGDKQEYSLEYVGREGYEVETFDNLIDTHKRARQLLEAGSPNHFKIIIKTIQVIFHDPRTTREINGKEIEKRQQSFTRKLAEITATPTENLEIDMDVLM
jgi:hypothetical protein